ISTPAIASRNTAQMEPNDTVHIDEAVTIRPSIRTNDIDQLLASLTFTSHLYADDPKLSSVMIDGRVFREGDTPRIGVDLVSITSTGVVLRYRGREVAYNVLAQWE
ncbi:MAG: general secretion pathway protein GspB, partial [Pseudomonadota bacterium]|nr:general secretion pathway protein GspB [Pseudomonadota bacterium]